MMSIVEYSKTEAALAVLREKHGRTFDVATTAGMKEAKQARAEVRGYRTSLEALRVELKAPALERCREIDAEAKRITNQLLAIEMPIDDLIKAEEDRKEAEKARTENERPARAAAARKLSDEMRRAVMHFAPASSAEISEAITSLSNEVFDDNEHAAELAQVKAEVIAALSNLLTAARAREAESKRIAEELAAITAMRAEAERAAKEAADKMEAAAKVERERIAEADRLARLERDRLEADARAARAEQDRIARVARDEEEARLSAERARIATEEERQRQERAELEAKAKAVRDAAEAKARAIEAERVRLMDARAMLAEFVRRYGDVPEFAGVVSAINDLQSLKGAA